MAANLAGPKPTQTATGRRLRTNLFGTVTGKIILIVALAVVIATGSATAIATGHTPLKGFFSSVAPPAPTSTPTEQPTPIALGKMLLTYRGHSDGVNAVAWSPDGTRIASGSRDDTVQVWGAGHS